MPRYHFHIVDGVEVFDSVRQVLPDNEAARTRAVELATNLGKAHLVDLTTKAFRVTNDKGAVLFRVPIRRAVKVQRRRTFQSRLHRKSEMSAIRVRLESPAEAGLSGY